MCDNDFLDLLDGVFGRGGTSGFGRPKGFSPDRPYFGKYQVRSLGEVMVGMKLISCYGGLNHNGEPYRVFFQIFEVVEGPYEKGSGFWCLKGVKRDYLGPGKDYTEEIYLRDKSVVPYENDLWNLKNWLERYREGVTKDGPQEHSTMFAPSTRISTYKESVGESPIKEVELEITFDHIGGQSLAKSEVMKLSAALNDPSRYVKWGTKPPRGICLFGPPGNGKTLLARALSSAAKTPFHNVDSSKLMSMWHGESEKNVDKVFAKAKKDGGIIFFDEADALAPSRNGDSHEASKRVVAALNRNMDGFDKSDKVVVFFATNRLEDMDQAVIRPGRIDRLIEVSNPNSEGRSQIFTIHFKKAEEVAERKLFADVDIESLMEPTKNFSGADIAEVVRRTLETKVHMEETRVEPGMVTTDDLLAELKKYERIKEASRKIGF